MMTSPSFPSSMSSKQLLRGFVADERLPSFEVTGVASDSRKVRPGYLFIAQPGQLVHAIDFTADAIHAGTVAVLYDARDDYAHARIELLRKQFSIHWIAVNDLRAEAGRIASRFFAHPSRDMTLIGITGTDGKTSVTHLLVQALTKMGEAAGSIGTLGYGVANNLTMTGMTTPDAIRVQEILAEFEQAGCEHVVMEVSSHALQQYRVSGCEFDIAVLTNLGSDHLDYHGSRESYAAAKSRLFTFENLKARVLNVDDEFGRQLAASHEASMSSTFAASPAADDRVDVFVRSHRYSGTGLRMLVATRQGDLDIQTGLIGAFNIDNCLAVISVLLQMGFTAQQVESAMQGLSPIPGRMEYLPSAKGLPGVVIDFAHTAQALKSCLQSLRDISQGDLYCVFGCGGDRDAGKRPLMARVAEELADHVIVTDDNPRREAAEKIMRDILCGFRQPERARVIHDRQTAIRTALLQAGTEDLVVIAGKGHEQVQIIGDRRLAYSDRQVVERIIVEAGE